MHLKHMKEEKEIIVLGKVSGKKVKEFQQVLVVKSFLED